MAKTGFGSIIKSINNVDNYPEKRTFWKVYQLLSDGSEVIIEKGLDQIFYQPGDTFIFRFETVGL